MRFLVLPLVLLLAASGSAVIVLAASFGPGVDHKVQNISANAGAPTVGARYYFTDSEPSVSNTAADAVVVTEVMIDGNVVYEELEKVGNCSWKAIVTGTVVDLSEFNGYSVTPGDDIKWAVVPNAADVTHCKLVMDYNVSA